MDEADGQLKGITVDVLMRMFKRAGVNLSRHDLHVLPWQRSYQKVLHEPDTVLFSTTYTRLELLSDHSPKRRSCGDSFVQADPAHEGYRLAVRPQRFLSHPLQNRRTIAIHCSRCRHLLYRYHKGGTGGLVKCLPERIVEDRTDGDLHCPECRQEFARLQMIAGKPAHKIIQGKVFTRGMRRK